MRLTDDEQAMRAGAFGPAVQWAIEHQIKVGTYLGADDFVPATQAHSMADAEALGLAGAERGADRPHAALWLSSRRAPASDTVDASGLHAARIERVGRARRHRRPPRRRLLAGTGAGRARPRSHIRRDEAFRRGAGELRL